MSIRRLWHRATAAGTPSAANTTTAPVWKETQPLKRAPRLLAKAFDIVVDTGAVAATWLIAAMAVTIGLEVLMRRVFSNSLPWVIQVNEYFVMAIPLAAHGCSSKTGTHA